MKQILTANYFGARYDQGRSKNRGIKTLSKTYNNMTILKPF